MIKNIVCTCSDTYHSYKNYWDSVNIEFDYVADITKRPLENYKGLSFTEQDIRDKFNFEGEVSKRHYWNSFGNRNIIWFYAHLRMLYYYEANPNYDYYWFYDDDVTIRNWKAFHAGFEDNKADFISQYGFKQPGIKNQSNVPEMDNRTTSKHMWFERFPGEGDILFDDTTELFGSFFPIVRYSNRAMAKLVQCLKEGIYGYSEGFVPTILNYYGMGLDTIFNSDSQAKYFDDSIVDVKHKNIKINWEWI